MSSSIENTINIAFVFQLQLYHQGLNVKTKVTINNYIVEYITTNLNIKYKEDVYVWFQKQSSGNFPLKS